MSTVGQGVGYVLGTVVGSYFGYPALGMQIGGAIGGAIDPPTVQGQKLGDIAKQTAREGGGRAIVFGTARPIGGNVIATTEGIVSKTSSGGKGGPNVESEEVRRTYAIGVCEGPISGYRRIWRDGKLVYFAGNPDWATNNARFILDTVLYKGEYDATPDPFLQAALGTDNVTPFRGTAYIVRPDEDLTNLAGRIPQWTFEVVRAEGFVLTSRPYPIEVIESIQQQGPEAPPPNAVFEQDFIDQSGPVVTSGSMAVVLLSYDDALPEAIDQSGPVITWGEMHEDGVTILEYTDGDPEAIDQSGPTVTGGTLDTILLLYEDWPPEAIDQSGPVVTGGSLV